MTTSLEKPLPLKQHLVNLSILLGSLLVVFLLLELAFRVRHSYVRSIPFLKNIRDFEDPVLGWEGKKHFGDLKSEELRVLIVGDSFTEGLTVPYEESYPSLLREKLSAEVFTYAGRGYGTLQQYLVIDRHIDQINPDLVVLQLCSNDFINNHWELERRSYRQNALMRRPYRIAGVIEYRFPRVFGELQTVLAGYSRTFHFIFSKIEHIQTHLANSGRLHSVEEDIKEQGRAFPFFHQSLDITRTIFEDLKARVGGAELVLFIADSPEPNRTAFRALADQAALPFIDSVPDAIRQAQENNQVVVLPDLVHWNAAGHRVVADELSDKLLTVVQKQRVQSDEDSL